MLAELLLATALFTQTAAPQPAVALDVPEPIFMTGCTAELNCPAPFTSGTVSCQGNVSCQVYNNGLYGVYCDGTFVQCYCSGMPMDYCNSPIDYCQCRAGGGSHLFCKTWCDE